MSLRLLGFVLVAAVLGMALWVALPPGPATPPALPRATTPPAPPLSDPGPGVVVPDSGVVAHPEASGIDSTRTPTPASPLPEASWTGLSVRSLERDTGLPLEGVVLSLLARGDHRDLEVTETTDPRGLARIAVPAGLAYQLQVDGSKVEASFEARAIEPLREGEVRELVVELRTGADLEYHGRIVDAESGEPIAGAQVQSLYQALSTGSIEQAVTQANGSFRLLLPAWRVVTAAVTAEGYGRIVFQPGPGFEDPNAPEDVPIARAGTLHGFVLDSGGAPMPGVHLAVSTSGWRVAVQKDRSMGWGAQDPVWTATTTADGSFRIDDLLARAPLDVVLRKGEEKLRQFVEEPLRPGEQRAVEWRVGAGARILGLALDASGEPRSRIPIWLSTWKRGETQVYDQFDERDVLDRTETAKDGSFALEDLAPGSYWLGPGPSGGPYDHDYVPAAQLIEIVEGEGQVEVHIELRAAGRITGRVQDPSGAPIAGLEVIGEGLEGDAWVKAPTDEDGHFALTGLEDEIHLLTTGGFSGPWTRAESIQARPGDEPLVIVLQRGGELRGRVFDARTGEPSEATVTLVRRDSGADEDFVRTRAGKPGSFDLGGLVPGTWDAIALRASDGRLGTARGIVVEAGEANPEVELRLELGGTLELAYEGEAEWTVFNVYWEDVFLHNGALSQGEVTQLNVPAGRITARMSLPDQGEEVREVTVDVDETKRLAVP